MFVILADMNITQLNKQTIEAIDNAALDILFTKAIRAGLSPMEAQIDAEIKMSQIELTIKDMVFQDLEEEIASEYINTHSR